MKTKLPSIILWDILQLTLEIQEWRFGWKVAYRNYCTFHGEECYVEPFKTWSMSKKRAKQNMYRKLLKLGLV
jgi:hypothetical protein